MLYVSHAIDEVASLAGHMVLLRKGRVLAQGRTNELIVRLDLPLAHGDTAATVIEGTVQQHDPQDHITTVAFSGGHLMLVSPRAHATGEPIRLRVQARDVSLALTAPCDTSILNVLPATVVALGEDSPGQMMVALDAGTTRLLARVTQRSAQALALAPGQPVFAQVKGIAIVN
jgi:molybdate transport system ATP-binding protein